MADSAISALSQILTFGLTDQWEVLRSGSNVRIPTSALAQLVGYPCQGRLTLQTGTPVPTSDLTGQATIYFTPFNGNLIALYTASNWKLYTFTERSLGLSGLTSGKNYDVFIYDNAGTLTLELSQAWTNDTTRADAITQQDGIDVKSGALTRRLIGTIRATAATTTEDSAAKRFIWNRYNQVKRLMKNATETADNWTYNTATLRQANANTANQLDYVTGDAASFIEVMVSSTVTASTSQNVTTDIGIDSTTVGSAFPGKGLGILTNAYGQVQANYKGYPGLGRHFIAWLEAAAAAGTVTWYGDDGANFPPRTSGIIGVILN